MSSNGGSDTNRRAVLRLPGAAMTVTSGAPIAIADKHEDVVVIRLRGTCESPLSFDETQARLRRAVEQNSIVDDSVLDDRAVPVFSSDHDLVEYVARIDAAGSLNQYYGATSAECENDAHEKARRKQSQLNNHEVSTQVKSGPDWDRKRIDEAYVTDHFGELNNNFKWFNMSTNETDDEEERNAFQSKVASSDDTINPYAREITVEHDWSVCELGSETISDAQPDTTGAGDTQVSIGFPPSAELSWSFNADGDITQDLTNGDPKISWNANIPDGGTSWFEPGSHVASNVRESGTEKLLRIPAEAIWEGVVDVYTLSHTWTVSI